MLAPVERFRYVVDVPYDDDRYRGGRGHLNNASAADILSWWFSGYLFTEIGWGAHLGFGSRYDFPFRHLSVTYESEAFGHEQLRCGVRAVSRGRRSASFEAALWVEPERRLIATATAVRVLFDMATERATEIPREMWATVEDYEGRPLPHAGGHEAAHDVSVPTGRRR